MRKAFDLAILVGMIPMVPFILIAAVIGLLWDMHLGGGKETAKWWHRGVKI